MKRDEEGAATRDFEARSKERSIARARGNPAKKVAAGMGVLFLLVSIFLVISSLVAAWPFAFMSVTFLKLVPFLVVLGILMLMASGRGRAGRLKSGKRGRLLPSRELDDVHRAVGGQNTFGTRKPYDPNDPSG